MFQVVHRRDHLGQGTGGEIVLVNPAAERLLGKSADEIVRDGFLGLVGDPDYVRAFLERRGEDMPETLVIGDRVLNFFAATINADSGAEIGLAALIRDVTAEKDLENQLRELSLTDKLTGLFNRRGLEEILEKELSRALRYGTALSVLFFDVDHFKKFNDTHGHDLGDRVLAGIAGVCRVCFRKSDFSCRYGGEEFCVVLPNTNSVGARVVAEKLRRQIEEMDLEGLRVTVTIGVATYPEAGDADSGGLLKLADVALYEGKRGGRNRVILWSEVGRGQDRSPC
ncbi:MAG: sensor domain-containing diguanylate cyclase [Magnetococcales bacterium]|nr:sensor domain-containing diguanylate cyclase [Magnetococcales bacterium]